MKFVEGLLAGRSHLAVLLGLAAAVGTIAAVSRVAPGAPPVGALEGISPPAGELPLRARGPLDARERALAAAAWSYVALNTDPATGLTASVKGHATTTLWDLGSQLLAVLSAEELGLVPRREAAERLALALRSLARLPLGEGGLPNKAYDTRTLAMARYGGGPAPEGIGWSALDVSRLLLSLSLVAWRHPELTPSVRAAVSRWRLEALSDGAALRGGARDRRGALSVQQEGRLGYEQHAAKALLPWGVPAPEALDWRAHLAFASVEGQTVPTDARDPRDHGGTQAALVPEPWLLDALEHGFDAATLPVARALLRAQERRHRATGRLTAVSEDALDRAPWFAWSAVVSGGETWVALGPDGKPAAGVLGFSTKAAVAWGVLFAGEYPERLLAEAARLVSPGEGLYAGRYDATWEPNRALSLNTNAVVLEALAYRVRGPAVRASTSGEAEGRP
jgi:uncharacterized protein DUF3131